MKPHTHLTAIHGIAVVCVVVIVFGTLHLYSLSRDDRFSRAWVGLGF
jgi:hypothetical protein